MFYDFIPVIISVLFSYLPLYLVKYVFHYIHVFSILFFIVLTTKCYAIPNIFCVTLVCQLRARVKMEYQVVSGFRANTQHYLADRHRYRVNRKTGTALYLR